MSDRSGLAAQACPAMLRHAVRAGLCVALALAMPAARAAPPDSVFLEDLTWTELRDAIGAGKTTALIPIGGTEQSGPDIALGKHNQRVRYLSDRIARALGNAIVAPVIAYVPEGRLDPPTSHMRFPGTITIPDETFQKTLEYAARSLREHGFRDIFFLGDHGGYRKDLQPVADRLNREWAAGPTRVHALQEYSQASGEGFARLLRERGFRDDEIGTHAALADTSLMLAVDPRAVRAEALAASPPPGPSQGVYGGDPRKASAELGRIGLEHIVSAAVAAIRARTARAPR
jgi:creatinine amidohydrolase